MKYGSSKIYLKCILKEISLARSEISICKHPWTTKAACSTMKFYRLANKFENETLETSLHSCWVIWQYCQLDPIKQSCSPPLNRTKGYLQDKCFYFIRLQKGEIWGWSCTERIAFYSRWYDSRKKYQRDAELLLLGFTEFSSHSTLENDSLRNFARIFTFFEIDTHIPTSPWKSKRNSNNWRFRNIILNKNTAVSMGLINLKTESAKMFQ